MAQLSLDLSDDLSRLAENFDQFSHGGIVMDGETVLGIVATLRMFYRAARKLENEVSQKRWNEAAQMERAQISHVLDEATRPGTNVKLFPVIRRPTPSAPTGAA